MIAISTAFNEALIAIEHNGEKHFVRLDSNCKHSENVLQSLVNLIDEAGIELTQKEEIAVVIGPGSFTGVRIGVALVKGLAAGKKINKVKSLTTLDLIAHIYYKATQCKKFTVVIDALSGLCFACDYENGKKVSAEKLVKVEEVSGLNLVCSNFDNLSSQKVEITPEALFEFAKISQNQVEVNALEPLYLRKSQAEDNLEQKKVKKV